VVVRVLKGFLVDSTLSNTLDFFKVVVGVRLVIKISISGQTTVGEPT